MSRYVFRVTLIKNGGSVITSGMQSKKTEEGSESLLTTDIYVRRESYHSYQAKYFVSLPNWAIYNVNFDTATARSIGRHNGVDVLPNIAPIQMFFSILGSNRD